MNKLIKTLIIINGIMMPLVLGIIIFQLVKTFKPRQEYNDEGIIIDERLEEAKSDSLALQGLSYDTPVEIYNSSNFYLPISVTTYKEAKDLRKVASIAGDLNLSHYHIMNVIFMDKDYRVIGNLVDKKASIIQIEIPHKNRYDKTVDKTVKNIGYLIGFDDTNNDGKLNSSDSHDLYITDLNGKNLLKATSNIDIESFDFINSNTQIFIRFKERSDLKEEHKKIKFGLFDIETSIFSVLTGLNNSINEIKKQLIN